MVFFIWSLSILGLGLDPRNRMNVLEIEYGALAAHLAIIAFVLVGIRMPAALAFSFMTHKAFAWAPVFGLIGYAQVLLCLQFLAVVWLSFAALRKGGLGSLLAFVQRKEAILLWVLGLIWLKILSDIIFGGLSMDRLDSLKTVPVLIFLPILVIFLSFLSYPTERVIRDMFVGMIVFSTICILPALPGVIEGRRFMLAQQGRERLALWGLDTIQGGQFFCFLALGGLGLSLVSRIEVVGVKPFGWAVFVAGFLLLVLNATRQFLLSCVVGLMLSVVISFRRSVWIVFAAAAFFFFSGFVLFQGVREASASERVSIDSLSGEVATSRGVIWTDAFAAGLARPLLGQGFRNFGNVVTTVSHLTDEVITSRDNAHGFYQDLWAEHGVVLGAIVMLASVWSFVRIVVLAERLKSSALYLIVYLNATLMFLCIFSGTVWSSLSPYVLAVTMLAALNENAGSQTPAVSARA